jgi:hypothetical protein
MLRCAAITAAPEAAAMPRSLTVGIEMSANTMLVSSATKPSGKEPVANVMVMLLGLLYAYLRPYGNSYALLNAGRQGFLPGFLPTVKGVYCIHSTAVTEQGRSGSKHRLSGCVLLHEHDIQASWGSD